MTDTDIRPGGSVPLQVVLRAGGSGAWVEWQLTVAPQALVFTRGTEQVEIKDAELSGVQVDDNATVVLHSIAGTTAYLRGNSQLPDVANTIIARNCTVREVTRPLRAFGARRGKPDADHDRFFQPLLSARTRAESAGDAAGRLAAFDAAQLRDAFNAALQSFSSSRYPDSPPDRRALYETINEKVLPLHNSLMRLETAADAARSVSDKDRFVKWRDWLNALDGVFAAADQCWLAILPALNTVRVPKKKFWLGLFG